MDLDQAIRQLYQQPTAAMEIRGPDGMPTAYLVKPEGVGRPLAPVATRRPKLPLSKRQRESAKHERLVAQGRRSHGRPQTSYP